MSACQMFGGSSQRGQTEMAWTRTEAGWQAGGREEY